MKSDKFSDFKPLIYLITTGKATAENFPVKSKEICKIIETAVETKISLVQIREKNLPARLVFELTARAVCLAQNSETKILVNDRADIALAAGADGVHLTANSLPTEIIRQNYPPDFIIGVSAHSIEAAEAARNRGADFATFSPIFHSPNKGKSKGLDELRKVCEKLNPFSVIALGGIDETNYREVLEIADGLAAIRFLNDAKNLKNF